MIVIIVGLPPKKPLCYVADLNDIANFFTHYQQAVKNLSEYIFLTIIIYIIEYNL